MKNILKHGKGKMIYNFTCNRCGCEFTADEEDVKIKESFFPWGDDIINTTCPECYRELSGFMRRIEYIDAYTACTYVNTDQTGTYTTTEINSGKTDGTNNTNCSCYC